MLHFNLYQKRLLTGQNINPVLIIGETNKIVSQLQTSLEKIGVHKADQILIAENPLSISTVRQTQRKIALSPFLSKKQVVIIYSADNASIEAQNALLKTLEEPSSTSILILIARNIINILPTIISRVEVYFYPIDKTENFPEVEMLFKGNLGDRLYWIRTQGSKIDNPDLFIDEAIIYTENNLSSSHNKINLLNKLYKAKRLIKNNVSLEFALESVII